jgi:hypothetical protein
MLIIATLDERDLQKAHPLTAALQIAIVCPICLDSRASNLL